MISVTGEVDCFDVKVEGDDYIPLKASWLLPRAGRPLYLLLRGLGGPSAG